MRRFTGLAPTLLALGLLPAAAWAGDAVSTTERDAQFDAVRSLIEREFRLPAKRQLAEFDAAGFPEAEWFSKCLAWSYADRFRVLSPDKAEKEALAKQAESLGKELEARKNDPKLPAQVRDMIGGTGKVLRLVTDVLRLVDPDQPLGATGLSGIPEEQRAVVVLALKTLAAESKASFDQAAAKIKANAKAEEDALAKSDMKSIEASTTARLEAVRPVYLARKAMREVAERGKEYGLDPAVAETYLKDFATANAKMLAEWDYTYGDYQPYLHVFLMDLIGDAIRFKLKGMSFEDIESDMLKTVQIEAAKEFPGQPAIAEEVRTLQAKSWGGIITWYRDLGRVVGPKYWQRGLEQWQAFKEATKGDRHFRLDHPNRERATEMARVYLAAGRLMLAKGDQNGAVAVFNQVAAVKEQPLAPHAKMWVQYVVNPPDSGTGTKKADWGETPTASEPAGALEAAKALLKVARATPDEDKARQFTLRAASGLRNGILGLASPGDQVAQDKADEVAPELWFQYSSVLNQLGLRWHAGVVAQEGLKQIKQRMAELPKESTVWKNKDGTWTKAGNYISLLSRNGIFYAQSLLSKARGPGTSALYDGTVSLVQDVSPNDAGRSLERLKLLLILEDKDWNRAIEEAKGYVKKYPEDLYWSASAVTIPAMLGKRGELKSAEDRKKIEAETLAFAKATADQADAELKKNPNPERMRELKSVKGDVLLVKSQILLDDDPGQVLDLLGADYWSHPPVDETKSVKALGLMCLAVNKYYAQRAKDEKTRADGKALLADWERYQAAYGIWRKQKARLPSQAEAIEARGANLAQTFVNIGNWAEQLAAQPGAPAGLGQIGKDAYKAFSDMIEPRLSESSKPDTVYATANILWELEEHERSARLYQVFVNQVAKDPDAAALRDTPKDILSPLDGLLNARPELKAPWAKARDLLEDAPDLSKKILEQDLEQSQWGEEKIDYVKAIAALRALREEAGKRRIEIGAGFAQIDDGLQKLEATTGKLAREITAISRLAVAYKEMGQVEKANEFYNRLIAYDPTNPDYLAAAVELVIKGIKDAVQAYLDPKVIEATQIKAARVREAAEKGSATYWTAVIQVLELASQLKDTKAIDKRLGFDAQNRSTPADDLQLLPREPRDDKRTRRARNVMAADLARRYLALCQLPGVTAKPSYRVDTIDIDGKPTVIFAPVDAPKFAAQKRVLEDGSTVWFIWEEGKEAPPEAVAAPPPPAEKPAEKAAVPAAPVQEKKP